MRGYYEDEFDSDPTPFDGLARECFECFGIGFHHTWCDKVL